jgi:GTP-binding protein
MSEIAVSGRSNVGKSTLLNVLLGRKNLARVSKEPGKTRTVNFFLANERIYFVDLPGYGYAKVSAAMRSRWKKIIFQYFEEREKLRGIIQLIDARHPPSRDDLVMLQHIIDAGRPFLVVFTKADKISLSRRPRVIETFKSYFEGGMRVGLYPPVDRKGAAAGESDAGIDVPVIFFSSKTKEGSSKLWSWINERTS